MHLDVAQYLSWITHPGALVVFLFAMAYVGIASGTPIPLLEGAVLVAALHFGQGILAYFGPDVLAVGSVVLLCLPVSALVMVLRFVGSNNQWVEWNYPSCMQLVVDILDWRRKSLANET